MPEDTEAKSTEPSRMLSVAQARSSYSEHILKKYYPKYYKYFNYRYYRNYKSYKRDAAESRKGAAQDNIAPGYRSREQRSFERIRLAFLIFNIAATLAVIIAIAVFL